MRSKKVLIYALVIVLILSWMKQYKTIKHQEDLLDEYGSALSEANDNIEEANSIIEEAQGYAWSDYYDMGYALDNLQTVDTVSDPGW